MEVGRSTVAQLFGIDRRYVVPLFQRPYVWQEEDDWAPLWTDIAGAAEMEARGDPREPHFLGAVVFDQLRTSASQIDARLVIDGQQRLTTLQLLLAALRDVERALPGAKYQPTLARLTSNDEALCETEEHRFKVWPTNVDQEHFQKTLRAGSPAALRQSYGAKSGAVSVKALIPDAYLFFHKQIDEWLREEGEPAIEPRLRALVTAIREKLLVVSIDLGAADDAQVIFETLNARGRELLPMDLVKNLLFQQARSAGAPIDRLHATYWAPFDRDNDYWRKEIGSGRRKRPRIDLFLQHYLTLQTGSEVVAGHLYVAFRRFAQSTEAKRTPEDHLRTLHEYATIYRRIDLAPDTTPLGRFRGRLETLQTTTVLPVLLHIERQFGDERYKDERAQILVDLESYLVRRMLCGVTAKYYNQLFLQLLARLSPAETSPAKVVREFLASRSEPSTEWPDDAALQKTFRTAPVYRQLAKGRLRMVLEMLDEGSRQKHAERMRLDDDLTIEHLMPQEWESNWLLPSGQDALGARNARDAAIHTIGNLTLLTQALNTSVSNGPWPAKRAAILSTSLLALNRPFAEEEDWDEARIAARGERLFEIARRIWPRPATQ